MTDPNNPVQPAVVELLQSLGINYDPMACDPSLADTADFCAHYGFTPEESANALLVASTKGEEKYAACLVLANCRLDVNKVVRKKLGVRKLSFANPEQTRELTGMELGGVTPIGLPDHIPVWIDARVMQSQRVVIGGGNRSSKIVLSPAELLKIPNSEVVENLAIEFQPKAEQ